MGGLGRPVVFALLQNDLLWWYFYCSEDVTRDYLQGGLVEIVVVPSLLCSRNQYTSSYLRHNRGSSWLFPEVDLPPQLHGDPRSSGTTSKNTWDVPLEEIACTRLLSCLYSVHLDFLSLLPFSLSHLAYMLALFLFLWFCLLLKLYSFNSFYWSLYLTPYYFNQPVWLCLNKFFIVKFLFFSIMDIEETKLRKCLQSFPLTHLLCKNHSDNKSSLPSYELSRLGYYLNLLSIICKTEKKKFFPKVVWVHGHVKLPSQFPARVHVLRKKNLLYLLLTIWKGLHREQCKRIKQSLFSSL